MHELTDPPDWMLEASRIARRVIAESPSRQGHAWIYSIELEEFALLDCKLRKDGLVEITIISNRIGGSDE